MTIVKQIVVSPFQPYKIVGRQSASSVLLTGAYFTIAVALSPSLTEVNAGIINFGPANRAKLNKNATHPLNEDEKYDLSSVNLKTFLILFFNVP